MESDLLNKPEVRELTVEAGQLVALAGGYAVANPEQYVQAGDALKRVKGAKDRLEKLRKSFTQPLDQAKKAIMDFFRAPSDQLDQAESRIKRAMIGYSEEQERIRREEQRKADEKAERERQKLARQAEEARLAGKTERAETLDLRQAAVVAPIVQREAPKVAGTALREVWKFDITNEMDIPRGFLMVDESKIRKVVQAMKGDTNIPGVRVYSEKQLAAGTA